MMSMRRWAAAGVIGLFGMLLSLHAADEPPGGLTAQQEKQKQLQAETERLVRRLETMVQVLEYYRLDKSAEKRMLDEMEKTLAHVSREQMAALIAHLETAAKTADEKLSADEREKARARHHEIISSLKGLLAKYDAVKDLDQAAGRLDDLARTQVRLFLHGMQYIHEWEDREGLSPEARRGARRTVPGVKEIREQADDQEFVRKDLEGLFKQIAAFKGKLPAEQEERLKRVEESGKVARLLDELDQAAKKMRASGSPANRTKGFRFAADLQWQAAGDLEELAHALRVPREKLTVLREARGRTEAALREQAFLMGMGPLADTGTEPEAPRAVLAFTARGRLEPRAEQVAKQVAVRYPLRDLADRQGWLEHGMRGTRQQLAAHVPLTAAKVPPIGQNMRDAQNLLRRQLAERALEPQGLALAGLEDLLADLYHLIAQEERDEADPLAALKKALAEVNKLLKEQKEMRDKTQEADTAKRPEQLPKMANQQQGLAKRTDAVSKQPMPAKAETRATLDRAARAMESAAKEMKAEKAAATMTEQDRAMEALAEAKKQLDEQIAEMEKRRDEIAQLEDAMQKLQKLEKAERMVADESRKMAKDMAKPSAKPDAKALAKKQAELMPQARDVGKMVEKTTPDAAKMVAEAGKNMAAAKTELDKPQPKPAAMEADKAANKLMDAQKMLAKALDERKAMEAAAQAATQPNTINPAAAAQQLAKAMEQTQQAMTQAQKAAQEGPQTAKALKQSQQATQAAMAALQQAQAQAPQIVQPPLQQAGQQLGQASQQLGQGMPTPASQAQGQAMGQMSQALQSLNAALAAMGQPGAQPGQSALASAGQPGQQPGQGQGQQPGQGQGQQPGQSQERNEGQGEGNRLADGRANNTKAEANSVKGDGAFLHLPPRQRELIRQALSEKLPPEYAAMIQQYYLNLARGQTPTPAPPPKR